MQTVKLQLRLVQMEDILLVQVKILKYIYGSMKSIEVQAVEKVKMC